MNEEAKVWGQLDIDDWEEPDSEEFREDVPEGFEWECCRKALHIKGCTRSKHEANPNKSKRGGESPHYKRENAKNPTDDEREDEDEEEEEEDEDEY